MELQGIKVEAGIGKVEIFTHVRERRVKRAMDAKTRSGKGQGNLWWDSVSSEVIYGNHTIC